MAWNILAMLGLGKKTKQEPKKKKAPIIKKLPNCKCGK